MAARRPPPRRRPEPAIALINVVFLLLVFFLVASRIAPPLPEGVDLVSAEGGSAPAPPGVVVVRADASLWHAGGPIAPSAAARKARGGVLRLMPDRRLPAARLLALARDLRDRGVAEVRVVGTRPGRAAP